MSHLFINLTEDDADSPRFVSRVIPISATSQATLHQLKAISMPVIKAGFETPGNTPLKVSPSSLHSFSRAVNTDINQFAVVVSSRNSQKLERLDMIKTVAENVELLEAGHSVDLGKPDRTIIIELAKVSPASLQRSNQQLPVW